MNQLYIGLKKDIKLPKGSFLLIDDAVSHPKGKIFDPQKHHFNPLKNIDYRKACDIVDIIDALFSRGESTLTKDTGLDYIHDALEQKPLSFEQLIEVPDRKAPTGHIWAYNKIKRLMRSPVLRRVFDPLGNQFKFQGHNTKIVARINRAELGRFDSLALGLFLIANYGGQIILPKGWHYLRDVHAGLVEEKRLTVRVRRLSELPLSMHLRDFDEVIANGTTFEDAEELANQKGEYVPRTVGYGDEVTNAMS